MSESLQLAEFASGLRFDQLPAPVIVQARSALLNYLACAISGAHEDVVERARRALLPYAGKGDVTLVSRQWPCDAITASFLNCLASTVQTFDETHARTVVHPVGPVASAVLAIGEERHASGELVLAGLIAGIEVASRASLAISAPPARGHVGWSQSGVCGAMGAAAGVARVLQLDSRTTVHAMGLGANAAAGLRAMNGTPAVTTAVSQAASNGVRAALLAAEGIGAGQSVLEDEYGFVALFSQEAYLPHLTEGLGHNYAVSELNFKPYPCGVVAFAAIDAASTLRAQNSWEVAEIQSVTVAVNSACTALGDRAQVNSPAQASVSIQFWVAAALSQSSLGTGCLDPEFILDPRQQELMGRVRLIADDGLSRDAARMTLLLSSGRELTANVDACLGSQGHPVGLADIERKFHAAARGASLAASAEQIRTGCAEFESLRDISAFTRMLRGKE
ncbi:MAG: MmgE/PrpD family protein [Pseudomonadota bacterium]